MSKESAAGMEEVAALMLERQRLESWLASLDAKKSSTPDDVFRRVRGDYAARLRTVTEQLLARRAALASHLEILGARLTQLEAEAKRFHDVRSESELRMHVGELSVTDWNAKSRECDESIIRLTEAQTVVRGQLAQARQLLSMVSAHASGASGPTPSVSSAPRSSRPVSPAEVRDGSASASNGAKTGMNELEFLNSVVGGQGGERPPPRPGVTPGTPAAPLQPTSSGKNPAVPEDNRLGIQPEGAPDLGESLLDRVNRRNGGQLRDQADAESLLQGIKQKPGSPNPLAANVTESNPIVLKPQGGPERHRTLKCAECGTMNYPTEWYCERCGAELAAL